MGKRLRLSVVAGIAILVLLAIGVLVRRSDSSRESVLQTVGGSSESVQSVVLDSAAEPVEAVASAAQDDGGADRPSHVESSSTTSGTPSIEDKTEPQAEERNQTSAQQASVFGRVVDGEGNPQKGIIMAFPRGMTKSDDAGQFHFEKVEPISKAGTYVDKVKLMIPGKHWYIQRTVPVLADGISGAADLGAFIVPSADPGTTLQGVVDSAAPELPGLLRMVCEETGVVALLAVKNDRTFRGSGFPAGRYLLSNTTVAGTAVPDGAEVRTVHIVLKDGETTNVAF